MHTSVDIVIPTYKPDDKILKIRDMLGKQTVKPNKLIIINTEEKFFEKYLSHFDANNNSFKVEIHHISMEEFDHGKTRNDGTKYSEADIVVFMTQDAVPFDEYLIEELIKPIENNIVKASYARQMPDENSSLAECFTRNFNYPDEEKIKSKDDIKTLGIKTFFCSDVCAAYDRKVFEKLGGFVNQTIFNEDMIYARKLIDNGYKISYSAKAKVIHTHEYTCMQQFRRNFDNAVSHRMYEDVFNDVSSESEGIKLIKKAFVYFIKNKKPYLIIPFGINCVYRYVGFKLGLKYDKLSKKTVLKCTSNKLFFEKMWRK